MSESSQSGTLWDVFTKQLWDAEVFTLTLFFSSSEGKEEAGGSAGNNPPSLYCLPSVGLVFRVLHVFISQGALGISQAGN